MKVILSTTSEPWKERWYLGDTVCVRHGDYDILDVVSPVDIQYVALQAFHVHCVVILSTSIRQHLTLKIGRKNVIVF